MISAVSFCLRIVSVVDAYLVEKLGHSVSFAVELFAAVLPIALLIVWATERRRTPYVVPAAKAAEEGR